MNEIQTIPLEFGYKGKRDYLQGPDMYNAIMEYLRRVAPQHLRGPVKMVMHDFSHNQCDMVYSIGQNRCPRPDNARLEFYISDNISGWLKETDRLVLVRRPYPEEEIVAKSRVEGQTVLAVSDASFSFSAIEVLVSLTKRLHLIVRSGAARWALTRLELLRPLQDSDSECLQVELLQALGNRLTKSAVRVGNVPLGHIFFSAVGA